MKYLLKIFIFFSLLNTTASVQSQVRSVQYVISPNENSELIDCFIYILEGEAMTTRERIQFNAQFSLIVPTNTQLSIVSTHMPLLNNQNFESGTPIDWVISSKVVAPETAPEKDFYGITPNLSPAGFYDQLKEGELVKLFTIQLIGEHVDYDRVRLYENEHDPKSYELGMQNGDFSNGFTMGGYHQLYKGNKTITEEVVDTAISHKG
ncbi:MAG: hypothetical protein P1U56_22085 [Saprospiraceae bacterium]|nr:hypothetical protein [Saprospiraceae bacterium]